MRTKTEIGEAFLRGKDKGAGYMLVVCDTFDYSNYPVYAADLDECLSKFKAIDGKEMQKVMEVYDLSYDMQEQLNTARCNRLPI